MQPFGSFRLFRPEGFSASGIVELWFAFEESSAGTAEAQDLVDNLVFVYNGTEILYFSDYTMGPTEDSWYYATIPLTLAAEGDEEPEQIYDLEVRSFYSEVRVGG